MNSEHSERMKKLSERLDDLKAKQAPDKPHQEEKYSQANVGWRMVTELVAGLLIGFGMGYGLDVLFGTLPVFLVIFTLLGLAAGIKTMMRTAKELEANATVADPANEGTKHGE